MRNLKKRAEISTARKQAANARWGNGYDTSEPPPDDEPQKKFDNNASDDEKKPISDEARRASLFYHFEDGTEKYFDNEIEWYKQWIADQFKEWRDGLKRLDSIDSSMVWDIEPRITNLIEAIENKKELKINIDCKMQGRLTEFCRFYIDDELKSARTAILTEVGISYSDYQNKYCGKDKKTLQQDEKLSVVQIAAILRANKTKPVKLTPEMILKRGRGSASRSPLGVKPETKRALTFGSKFCTTCITSVLTGVIMLDVIVNPTWATFAACCLKLLPIVLNGFLGYKSGFDNITVATINYIGDQSDLLQRAIQYIESTPEPVQIEGLTSEPTEVEIAVGNEGKTAVQE